MASTIDLSNSADNCDVAVSDLSFAGCIADGVYFDSARLTQVTFSRCDLYGASFLMAPLDDVVFDRCDLRGSDFAEAVLTNCRFLQCDVGTDAIGGDTRFDGVDLSAVEFMNCRGR